MDPASDIAHCRRLLDQLEEAEKIDSADKLIELEHVFNHLPPQTAPRLQKDLDFCITRSDKLLGELFDRAEISDKSLLNSLLRLLLAYGNMRIALIVYHIETARDEIEPDVRYTPLLVKTKWYDLSPLLPAAGTMTWKSILIHGLVKDPENPTLRDTCAKLLEQKLHFYASIKHLDRFRKQSELIDNNAHKVAERLSEGIFDSANDDEEVVMLDPFLYNLLISSISKDQQAALLEAIIISKLKAYPLFDPLETREKSDKQLDQVICKCIMSNASLQEIFFLKMVDQLKCNVVRRKRRHSVEAEGQDVNTLESILGDIINGSNTKETFLKLSTVEVTSKILQKSYLVSWMDMIDSIITRKSLTPKSSATLLSVCISVLLTCSKVIDESTKEKISMLLAKIIDSTGQRKLDKLLQTFNPYILVELTKLFADLTDLLDEFETPLIPFYKSYFGKHMRLSAIRHFQKDAEKLSHFIEFICDRTVGRSKSNALGYIYLCELSSFLESIKTKSKVIDLYVKYGRSIALKLYSFINKRQFTKQTDVDEYMDTSQVNGCDESQISTVPISNDVQKIVIDALVCVLKIAVDCKDEGEQPMLETYSELMLKLYNHMVDRVEELVTGIRYGVLREMRPIDSNLHRLINLYIAHKSTIQPYLCYELDKNVCERLLDPQCDDSEPEVKDELHTKRKSTYAQIKSKLEDMKEKEEVVYQTIINRQYSTVVDQNLGQVADLTRGETCAKHYLDQMAVMTDVLAIGLNSCTLETYDCVLSNVGRQFQCCDALDHPKVLYLLHVLVALIPKHNDKDARKSDLFKKKFATIGCCLIRITKSVELGPSVLSFTNPGTHKSSGGIQCCTYSNCILVYTLVFNRFPPAFTNPLITDAMQICVSANLIRYAKNSTKFHKFFIQLASSITSLLKAICMGKRDMVEQAMPIYLSVFSLLVRCIILASDRRKLDNLPHGLTNGHSEVNCSPRVNSDADGKSERKRQIYESQLQFLARDVDRLLNNLCFLETKLVDYAPHLISTYLKDTQRAACPDFVKKHLDEGFFRVFNLVDSYQKDRLEQITEAGIQRKTAASRASGSVFDMIHARLDQASREIFKDMHDNYNRFHRYLGKC